MKKTPTLNGVVYKGVAAEPVIGGDVHVVNIIIVVSGEPEVTLVNRVDGVRSGVQTV